MRFLDILVVFRLDFGQISFINLVEMHSRQLARQLALLATKIAFYDILAFSFFSFSFLFAAVIDLLLGLRAVK